jgi:flagellar biosynthesis/type III secretory pathway chaperone
MSPAVAQLIAAFGRVVVALDAEVEALRLGQVDALSAVADRKRAALEDAEVLLRQTRDLADVVTPADRACLIEATRRVQAAAKRNATTLEGMLEGTRRLYACLADAAQAAASSGTYRADGSRHCAEESAGTVRRSA